MRPSLKNRAWATALAVTWSCGAVVCGWGQSLRDPVSENGLAAPPTADIIQPSPLTSSARTEDNGLGLLRNIGEDLGNIALAPVSIRSSHMLFVIPAVAAIMMVRNDDADFYGKLHEPRNKFYDDAMPLVTSFGDGMTELALCSGLYALGGSRERRTADRAIEALADTGVTVAVLKGLFAATRPEDNPDGHVFFDYSRNLLHAGFPSGHTAAAFAFATVIGRSYHAEVPATLLAIGVGYSRVYLSAHWPSDVLAGALVGTLIGNYVLDRRGVPDGQGWKVGPALHGSVPAMTAEMKW